MPKKRNQHYLPKYYFRFFSRDRKRINVLHVRDGRLVKESGIKGQCSRSYFYGDDRAEEIITSLEDRFRPALSSLQKRRTLPADRELLLGALLFQRGRSRLERERPKEAFTEVARTWLEAHANRLEDEGKRELILRNLHLIEPDPRSFHAATMAYSLQGVPQIQDLGAVLIESTLPAPFIFSDSPVVFFNEASAHIDYRGSYGVACAGLQIVCPLDPTLLVFLYDSGQYEIDYAGHGNLKLTRQADLDALNALQLHNCLATAYFHDWKHRDYVLELWESQMDRLVEAPAAKLEQRPLVRPADEERSEVMHIFDPPLNTSLDLSFVETTPVPDTGSIVFRDKERALRLAQESEAFMDGLLDDTGE